jgi:hypothetical protein
MCNNVGQLNKGFRTLVHNFENDAAVVGQFET